MNKRQSIGILVVILLGGIFLTGQGMPGCLPVTVTTVADEEDFIPFTPYEWVEIEGMELDFTNTDFATVLILASVETHHSESFRGSTIRLVYDDSPTNTMAYHCEGYMPSSFSDGVDCVISFHDVQLLGPGEHTVKMEIKSQANGDDVLTLVTSRRMTAVVLEGVIPN